MSKVALTFSLVFNALLLGVVIFQRQQVDELLARLKEYTTAQKALKTSLTLSEENLYWCKYRLNQTQRDLTDLRLQQDSSWLSEAFKWSLVVSGVLIVVLEVVRVLLICLGTQYRKVRALYKAVSARPQPCPDPQPESSVPGSTVMTTNEELPGFQLVFKDANGAIVGSGIRLADYLIVPGHVRKLSSVVCGTMGILPVSNLAFQEILLDVEYAKVDKANWSLLGSKASKPALFDGSAVVRIMAPAENGKVRSTIGELEDGNVFGQLYYRASTEPGFSGSPYLLGKNVAGIHLGGGLVNYGTSLGYIEAILLAKEKNQPESPIMEVLRGAKKMNRKFTKAYLPDSSWSEGLVAVRYRGRYYVVDDDPELFDDIEEEEFTDFVNKSKKSRKAARRDLGGDVVDKIPDPYADEFIPSKYPEASFPTLSEADEEVEKARRLAQQERKVEERENSLATIMKMVRDLAAEVSLLKGQKAVDARKSPAVSPPTQQVVQGFRCADCGDSRVYKDMTALTAHKLMKHGVTPEASQAPHAPPKPWACRNCGKSFATKASHWQHVKAAHQTRPESAVQQLTQPDVAAPLVNFQQAGVSRSGGGGKPAPASGSSAPAL